MVERELKMNGSDYRYYFAYGSNMDLEQMGERCPDAFSQEIAKLSGYKFIINGRGNANVVPDNGSEVYGVLWRISRWDEEALDRCEGVPKVCTKVYLNVEAEGDRLVRSLVYVDEQNITLGVPSAVYIETIISGATYHLLPERYMEELRSWKKAQDRAP